MPTCIPAPIAWTSGHRVRILDQTLLPGEESYRELETVDDVAEAIRKLRVRGAPLIGIAAAMGVAMEAGGRSSGATEQIHAEVERVRKICEQLAATRPTAVNLRWALDRMYRRAKSAVDAEEP